MKEINDELLARMAGNAAFGRGAKYFMDGRVCELRYKGNTITAEVEGTESWEVTLRHTARVFEGSCDCPASDNIDFCKHCVAVAMAYRETLVQEKQLVRSKAKDRLPAYLMTLEKPALVDMLMEQLKNDPIHKTQLAIKADLAVGKIDEKGIKKRITQAIPYNRHLHRYPQVRAYFQQLEATLENLEQILLDLPPAKALSLIDYAMERIERALETIDDSGGFRYESLERLAAWHRSSLIKANMPAEKLAAYLFNLYEQPIADLYPAIPDDYADELGKAGWQQFISLIQQAWDALPQLTDGKNWGEKSRYSHLATPLLKQAQEQGDSDALIAIQAKTACDFSDYLRLSELCLSYGQLDQALWWRKRAERAPEKHHWAANRLEDNQIAIWLHTKDYAPVVDLLWQRFSLHPSLEGYKAVIKIPGQENNLENQKRALELAWACFNRTKEPYRQQSVLDSLAELYLHFDQAEEALKHAENYKLKPQLLKHVVGANLKQPERVLPLLFRLAGSLVEQGNNDSYQEAVKTLAWGQELASGKLLNTFTNNLQALHTKYQRKRNFSRWLQEAMGDLL